MTLGAPSITDFDPQSQEYYRDPQKALLPLIGETPVFHHAPTDAYYVLPYAEVRSILSDDEAFSSHAVKGVPVRAELRPRIPEEWERAGHVIQGGQISNLDAPAHTPQRRAMQRAFTHKQVTRVRPDIEAIADELIDGFIDRGACDLMEDFATRLALRVVGTLMDVPAEMLPGFHAWVADLLGVLAPIDLEPEDVTTPDDQLVAIFSRVHTAYVTYSAFVAERRANLGDDLCSALLGLTDDDGRPVLSDDDVLAHMVGTTAAGADTTANLIVSMVRCFTEHPDQRELVLDQPALWDNAVAEGLRRFSPAHQIFRVAKRDSVVAGVTIPAGAKVALSLAGANADPLKFPDPLRFDVGRENAAEHLGFGRGRHFCVGAPLAPPETRIALEVLYRRLPNLRADLDQELHYVPSLVVRGITSQRVAWDT